MKYITFLIIFFFEIGVSQSQTSPKNVSEPMLPTPLDVPQMIVTVNNNPADGLMYVATNQLNAYGLILDKNGDIRKILQNGISHYNDFKPHPNGMYSYFDDFKGMYIILDTAFTIIDSVAAPDPYLIDSHEFLITSDTNYVFIANDFVKVDMSKTVTGGNDSAVITAPVILEIDRKKNIIFEWHSMDHFKITDATFEDLTASSIDFCHMNAIEFDADGNLLISSRHMDEITKIDKKTGAIIWRWGGKNNQFTFEGDTLSFSHQHSIRRTDAGTYIMFDNGTIRSGHAPFSRAVEYRLDQKNKIATGIWEYRHTPDVRSASMGSVQRLKNGNTFIGWGTSTSVSITEVDSNKNTHFEMILPDNNYSYRAYKYDTNYVSQNRQSVKENMLSSSDIIIRCSSNPISGVAHIHCEVLHSGSAALSLYDAIGRKVMDIYEGKLLPGSYEYTFDPRSLSQGIYHIQASLGSSSIFMQVLIIR
jgi:hypothetical protein